MNSKDYSKEEIEVIEKYNQFYSNNYIFMNDGYVDLDDNDYPINSNNLLLDEKYKDWKYQINLYYQILSFANITNDNSKGTLLDLGCGKGGGISFYKDYYKFDKLIGIDLNANHIDFCKNNTSGIEFYESSAISTPLADNSIDIITSVESCTYYTPFENYVKEMYRILKKDGIIIQTCPYNKKTSVIIKNIFREHRFNLLKEKDIVNNVRMACAISKFRFKDKDKKLAKIFHDEGQCYIDPNNKDVMYEILVFNKSSTEK
jgi:ubiquinone/menaquinone biosynthesis C-methylase UbiE